VLLDGRILSPEGGYNLRAAPGVAEYDFRQWLDFRSAQQPLVDAKSGQRYVANHMLQLV
jgi:hypothetical protein